MSRLRSILLILVLLASLAGCSQAKTKSNQVLLVLAERSYDMDYMLENEISVMVNLLKKAGYEPVLASPTGQILGSNYKITPDMKLSDVKLEEYAGVIFPCMAAMFDSPYYPEPIQIAQKAAALKKPIAAEVHGLFTLSAAGVMNGKQYTLISDLYDSGKVLYNAGLVPYGIYKGEGVVQDGNIFTAGVCPFMARETGKPTGTQELIQQFVEYMKANQ